MMKRALLGPVLLVLLAACGASAQVCPLNGTTSNKLVCLIPQVYGPLGLNTSTDPTKTVLLSGLNHEAHFENEFLSNLGVINTAVGIQVSQLPIASPSSGITFVFDRSLNTLVPSTDESLGPIIGERASTIGRNKLFVGFSYQYFGFSSIDGRDTDTLPSVYRHQPALPNPQTGTVACPNQNGLPSNYSGDICAVRDFIQTTNKIDLTVHQYTIYLTYGITRHLDFSAAIPFLNVHMSTSSQATIVPNSVAPPNSGLPGTAFHQFNPQNALIQSQCAQAVAANQPCLNATFANSGSAKGIGDVVFRGKYTVYKGEHAGIAVGMDVRVPTGDELNFLGSGSTGVKPFGVFSYSGRIAPHVELGYEVNGDSTLAGSNLVPAPAGTTPTAQGSIPNRFIYIVGADVSFMKRLTGAFDIYGQRLFNALQLVSQPFTDFGHCSDQNCTVLTPGTAHPDIGQTHANFNITNASLGLKYRAFSKFVITGNVLLKVDSGGLRARAVPLVGVSYSF